MTPRARKFISVVHEIPEIIADSVAKNDGWPGVVAIPLEGAPQIIALHVANVSPHARKPHEMRFQNPAKNNRPPVSNIGGTALPILLGVDNTAESTVFIAVNGSSRLGSTKRFSILFNKSIISRARSDGLSVYQSSKGERIYAFTPSIFNIIITHILNKEALSNDELLKIIISSGALADDITKEKEVEAVARASRLIRALARKSGAGLKIRTAYEHKCAMCGIGSNLLQGAHIYPVEAPGSTDEVWNGLSLCHNHHGAFDLHLIWINPLDKSIHLHPSLHEEARTNSGTRHFVESTHIKLTLPVANATIPRDSMFTQRYAYFIDRYDWAAL